MSGPSRTGTSTWTTNTVGATRVAGERCSAVISATSPTPDAHPVASTQITAATQCPAWVASAASCVESPLHAKHSPATSGAAAIARGRLRTSSQVTITTAARPASTAPISTGDRVPSRGVGANAASAATPATIAATAARSPPVTRSPSRREPAASSATRPTASAGWTTDSGASSIAAACGIQPRTPSAVPSSHSGRRSRRPMSPARHACSLAVLRASIACRATPAL